MSTTPATIPIITPSTAPLPVTGAAANNINAISQDVLNFLPVAQNAVKNIQTAAAMPSVDPFHQALNIALAADQSITPFVPNGVVQSVGGLAAIALAALNLIPNAPAPTAAELATASASGVKPNAHPNFFFQLFHPNVAAQEKALAAQQAAAAIAAANLVASGQITGQAAVPAK